MSSRLKGSLERFPRPPGYHLKPKYDLHALRIRRFGGGNHPPEFDLPLTSMIDMFSLLAIFLLMQFSSTGDIFFIPSKELVMPYAIHGRALDSAPLISILNDNTIRFDIEKVEDIPVSMQDNGEDYPSLRSYLRKVRSEEEKKLQTGSLFQGQVNLQADQETNLGTVKKIMNVLISEGWNGINFAVRPGKG